MNLFNIIRLNFKKLTVQKGKALFLIVPLLILVFITVILVSQLKNFQTAIDNSVFETLKNQATLIQVDKSTQISAQPNIKQGGSAGGGSFQQINFDSNFSQADLAKIQALENVESASLNTNVPISNISTTDLFEDINYKINQLGELDSTSAGLYTEENFDYTENEVIPIILNSNSFIENYEDWKDKTSISIDFQNFRPGQNTETTDNPSPIKSRAIEYDKDTLIGTEFTLNFGGLDTINDYVIDRSGTSMVFRKLTSDEYNAKINERKTAISQYWDYDKISKPLTYKFKVVGVTAEGNSSYIPQKFANKLMKDLIQNQLSAKKSTPSNDLLDKTFLGLSYDGTQFSTTSGFGFNRTIMKAVTIEGGTAGRFGAAAPIVRNEIQANPTNSYTIPGLIIKTSSDGQNNVEGIVEDTDVYANSIKTAQTITVKVDSVYNRSNVVKAINDAGFAFQDVSDFSVFTQIQSTIQAISVGFIIGFILLTILIILLTMMKFVSDSRKEVGIFRAIGMKKFTVLLLFTSQAILYTVVGSILGFGLGVVANYALSPIIGNTFNNFISETIKKSFNVVVQNDSNLFYTVDFKTIGIYLMGLLLISFIVSLIPAFRATTISPVEAIKGE